jgi:hypothetical protein
LAIRVPGIQTGVALAYLQHSKDSHNHIHTMLEKQGNLLISGTLLGQDRLRHAVRSPIESSMRQYSISLL